MKNSKKSILLFTLLLTFSGAYASQSTTLASNTTSTSLGQMWNNIKARSSFSHFSIFEGPALRNINDRVVDEDGNEDGQINSWHQISYRYKINDRFRFVINPRFGITYGNDPDSDDENFELLNPVIGIAGTWYKGEKLRISGGLNTIFANVEEGSQEDQLVANPGGFQTVNYKLNNKWDVGSWVWFRTYFFSKDANEEAFKASVSPYVQYTVNDKISFQAWYDTYHEHDEAESSNNIHMRRDTDAGVGMYYALTKKLTIFPHIKVNPDKNYNTNSMTLNAWLFGSF